MAIEVGYTEGANNVSEFDITKYLRTGKNNVAVQVIRWSDGSYLEGSGYVAYEWYSS